MNNLVLLKTEMGPKKHKFSFITKTSVSDTHVRCNICVLSFSVSHCGRGDIKTHLNSDKHKTTISAPASSLLLTTFFRPEKIGNKEEQLAATEGAFAYHTVSHDHSFRSMDCTSKLF
jgi:hypothetical protein